MNHELQQLLYGKPIPGAQEYRESFVHTPASLTQPHALYLTIDQGLQHNPLEIFLLLSLHYFQTLLLSEGI